MNLMLRITLAVTTMRLLFGATAAVCTLGSAGAQPYPSRPITWMVGAAAGGGADFVTRKISAQMATNLGQSIIVVNRPSGNGFIVATAAKNSPSDGYTVLSAQDGIMVNNMALYQKLPYDPEKDFIPVSLLNRAPILLVVHPSFPANDLKAFVELAKRSRPYLQYGAPTKGGPHHLAMEMLKRSAGFEAEDVHYKGSAPAVQDLLAGQIRVLMLETISALPLIKAGSIRALAILTPHRLAILPNVPTAAEQGFPGAESSIWLGLFAPAGTPKEIVSKLSAEVKKTLDDPKVAKSFLDSGTEPVSSTPEDFAAFIANERSRKVGLIKSLKISVD